jgi:hypothetical protein
MAQQLIPVKLDALIQQYLTNGNFCNNQFVLHKKV